MKSHRTIRISQNRKDKNLAYLFHGVRKVARLNAKERHHFCNREITSINRDPTSQNHQQRPFFQL